jgi:hypothetical protein
LDAESIDIFCSVVNELERNKAFSVGILQTMYNDSNKLKVLEFDVVYIHANLNFL